MAVPIRFFYSLPIDIVPIGRDARFDCLSHLVSPPLSSWAEADECLWPCFVLQRPLLHV